MFGGCQLIFNIIKGVIDIELNLSFYNNVKLMKRKVSISFLICLIILYKKDTNTDIKYQYYF